MKGWEEEEAEEIHLSDVRISPATEVPVEIMKRAPNKTKKKPQTESEKKEEAKYVRAIFHSLTPLEKDLVARFWGRQAGDTTQTLTEIMAASGFKNYNNISYYI